MSNPPPKNPFTSGGSRSGTSDSSPFNRNPSSAECQPSTDSFAKRVAALNAPKDTPVTPEKVTGDNYQKSYLQEVAAQRAAQDKKRHEDTALRLKKEQADALEAQSFEEQKRKTIGTARARELRGQITHWQTQLGQDPDTDNRTQGLINSLMNELNGIPAGYR